ncbi:MAG: hypothetical protein LUD84_01490 [Clostridiales bacterium]|nr:hypothetical protein [Clostridiales bacterium]
MKRWLCILTSVCLLLSAVGCAKTPTAAEDGTAWDGAWTTIGGTLGIDEDASGMDSFEKGKVYTDGEMYYGIWSLGEEFSFETTTGSSISAFDATLYLLLEKTADAETAEAYLEDGLAYEQESNDVAETYTVTCNGHLFTVLVYPSDDEDVPYTTVYSAFTTYDSAIINAELNVQGTVENPKDVLETFLNSIHFASLS